MIDSLQNDRVKAARKLTKKKHRQAERKMLLEGENLVRAAMAKDLVEEVFVLGEEKGAFLEAVSISERVMKSLTDLSSLPEVVAVARFPAFSPPGDRVLFLEHIQDPGNVGTLLRSALAFGFRSVVGDRAADFFSPKVLRATQGAIFDLNLQEMPLEDFCASYPDHVVVAASSDETAALSARPQPPFVLVLGNEGGGLSQTALAAAHHKAHIPTESVESLNVAVAGSILMHHLHGSRKGPFRD